MIDKLEKRRLSAREAFAEAAGTVQRIFASFAALSILILVEGVAEPPQLLTSRVAIYCFAIALPCCLYWYISAADPENFAQDILSPVIRPSLRNIITFPAIGIGLLLPIIGLTAWLWALLPGASIAFVVITALLIIAITYGYSSGYRQSRLPTFRETVTDILVEDAVEQFKEKDS